VLAAQYLADAHPDDPPPWSGYIRLRGTALELKMLQMLATTRFKEAPVKLVVMHDGAGGVRVETWQNMLTANNEERGAA
jgi:hypothetical protein